MFAVAYGLSNILRLFKFWILFRCYTYRRHTYELEFCIQINFKSKLFSKQNNTTIIDIPIMVNRMNFLFNVMFVKLSTIKMLRTFNMQFKSQVCLGTCKILMRIMPHKKSNSNLNDGLINVF